MLSFDLETTSTDTKEARIVTSALVRIDDKGAHPSEMLADPGVDIPEAAQRIHGITTQHAQEHGRPHQEVLDNTVAAIRQGWDDGLTLVVFNAAYDLSVLRALTGDFTVDGLVFDPYVVDQLKDQYRRGRRTLGALCKHYKLRLDNAHEATADATAAARLAWRLARVFPELTTMSGDELMEMQTVGYYTQQKQRAEYFQRQGRDVGPVRTSWPMEI